MTPTVSVYKIRRLITIILSYAQSLQFQRQKLELLVPNGAVTSLAIIIVIHDTNELSHLLLMVGRLSSLCLRDINQIET